MAAKEAKPAQPASHDKEVKVQKSGFARISPSAKLLIAQHKLDASSIMASGAHGTLLKSDVKYLRTMVDALLINVTAEMTCMLAGQILGFAAMAGQRFS